MKLQIPCFALILAFICPSEGLSQLSALRKALMDGYDKEVKPDEQVIVQMSLHVNDLKLCPHSQILTVHGWTQFSWSDSRLAWDPEHFGGLSRLRINSKFLWIPDITEYHGVDTPKSNFVTWEDNTNAIVMSNGLIIFVPPTILKSHCNVNYEDWPWGTQNCTLKFGSWTYDKENMDIQSDTNWSSCPEFGEAWNDQLQILGGECYREEKAYDCCPDELYPSLSVNLMFKFTQKFMKDELRKSP